MARRVLVVIAVAAVALTGCTKRAPSASPSPSPSGSPTVSVSPSPSGTPCSFAGTTAAKAATKSGGTMLLTDVRAGAHPCFDRVVLEFTPPSAGARLGFKVEYRSPPFATDPEGKAVTVAGSAFLFVRLEPAAGADLSKANAPVTYTGPKTLDPKGLLYVREMRETGDFEGVMTWIIGLASQRPFTATALSSPTRLVIDVG